jgi:hypothetical protein
VLNIKQSPFLLFSALANAGCTIWFKYPILI